MPITQHLRPYQTEVGRAVMESVLRRRGRMFTVEMARQGGKNELSAQLELFLLTMHAVSGGSLVKAAPTFLPQALISMQRLKQRLDDAGYGGMWAPEQSNGIRLGRARQLFLSAEPSANVVGATASVLLEVDEAQDVDPERFARAFRPMGASTNATTVLYGTPWDHRTLLEEMAAEGRELELRDGTRRHFRFDWETVAAHNPLYRLYVESERTRLGEEHPLFRTQYRLLPVAGGGGLFTAGQRAQLQGDHARQSGAGRREDLRGGPGPGRRAVGGAVRGHRAHREARCDRPHHRRGGLRRQHGGWRRSRGCGSWSSTGGVASRTMRWRPGWRTCCGGCGAAAGSWWTRRAWGPAWPASSRGRWGERWSRSSSPRRASRAWGSSCWRRSTRVGCRCTRRTAPQSARSSGVRRRWPRRATGPTRRWTSSSSLHGDTTTSS